MKKTSLSLCKRCKYSSPVSGGAVMCNYLEMTNQRRCCPVGYCDKYEKIIKRRAKK